MIKKNPPYGAYEEAKLTALKKKKINCRNIIVGYKSIISILKRLSAGLAAKQHRKEVIS